MSDTRVTDSLAPGLPPRSPVAPLPAGSVLADRYEIRRFLAMGGSGLVYAAFDRELRTEVALKVLRPDRLSERTLKRLRGEVQVARRADSPHLVRVFDIGHAGGTDFLTMELVDGEPLRSRLKGPLPVDEALRLAEPVLEGLAALHRVGVVHRDVKPGNVMVTTGGAVKLGDFGLARRFESDESRATEADALVGTAEYISPEQALGKDVDARSDLYSFGVLLFEMLTGRAPWQGESALETVMARLQAAAPDVRVTAPRVPSWLAEVVAKLLERRPADRYDTVEAVLADLRRRSVGHRALLRALKRRTVVLTAAALVALAAGAVAWRSWRDSRFDRLVLDGQTGTQALDRRGRVLWRNADLDFRFGWAFARLAPGDRPVVATILGSMVATDQEKLHTLSFLDPQSGATLRTATIPRDKSMPFLSERYRPDRISVADLDDDGVDEVFISFIHVSEGGSYVVLFDPERNHTRLVFVAYGHHRFGLAADVDGDGAKEAVLDGINNGFGWYKAVALVRLVDLEPHGTRERRRFPAAYSPDREQATGADGLLDYVLLPRSAVVNEALPALSIEPGSTVLRFPDADGSFHRIDLSGCGLLGGPPSTRPCAERRAARMNAYSTLRDAAQRVGSGEVAEALPGFDVAARLARDAADPILGEWVERARGKALVAAGRVADAERLYEALALGSRNAPEILHEAAVASHLNGLLPRAASWYRSGYAVGSMHSGGRSRHYMLEGEVLVLGEMGRWREAMEAAQMLARDESVGRVDGGYLADYVLWRTGQLRGRVVPPLLIHDFRRLLWLEYRLAAGEKLEPLLADVDRELTLASRSPGLLLSLKSELLDRLGRRDEALSTALHAWQEVRSARHDDVRSHALFDLVTERFAALADRAGLAKEAGDARRYLAEVRWKPGETTQSSTLSARAR